MNYFSEKFIDGLKTKSQVFQDEFWSIMNGIKRYIDDENELKEFHKYIEENHEYGNPGNVLYYIEGFFGGEYAENEFEKLRNEFNMVMLDMFDTSPEESFGQVPHIVVCISAPEGCYTDDEIKFVQQNIKMERLLCEESPSLVDVTVITNDTSNNRGNSYFIAALK